MYEHCFCSDLFMKEAYNRLFLFSSKFHLSMYTILNLDIAFNIHRMHEIGEIPYMQNKQLYVKLGRH